MSTYVFFSNAIAHIEALGLVNFIRQGSESYNKPVTIMNNILAVTTKNMMKLAEELPVVRKTLWNWKINQELVGTRRIELVGTMMKKTRSDE